MSKYDPVIMLEVFELFISNPALFQYECDNIRDQLRNINRSYLADQATTKYSDVFLWHVALLLSEFVIEYRNIRAVLPKAILDPVDWLNKSGQDLYTQLKKPIEK